MHAVVDVLGPAAVFTVVVSIYVGLVFASAWLFVHRPRARNREPGLLREPAYSLRQRRRALDHRLVGAAVGIPVAMLAWALIHQQALAGDDGGVALLVLVLAGVAALGWFAQELLRLWPERVRLLRAIAAQGASEPSLNLLMRQGYWVFHDVHFADRRIDHLVVGKRGIFCVESMPRRVRARWTWRGPERAGPAHVAFDGHALHFPGWTEADSFLAVQEQARQVQRRLARALDEPEAELPTFPAVALPGWRVASRHWRRLIVFNPATPMMLVQATPSDTRLDGSTVQRIVRYLQSHAGGTATPAAGERTRVRRPRRQRLRVPWRPRPGGTPPPAGG